MSTKTKKDDNKSDAKIKSLENFNLFYEELPIEEKQQRLINETRIKRKSKQSD